MVKCKIAVEEGANCQRCCFYCNFRHACTDECENCYENCDESVIEEETELDVINSAVPDVLKAITSITVQKKKLEEQEKLMKQKLLEAMEQHGVKSFENADVKFLYVAPTTRTTIDSTKLKKDHPDIAEQYSKTSNVSASVRITVK
jgi:predicted phage-related endonuclease